MSSHWYTTAWYHTHWYPFHWLAEDVVPPEPPIIAKPPTYLEYVPNVTVQEPPYNGPFMRAVEPGHWPFDPNVYAIEDNPLTYDVRWCRVCKDIVLVYDRPGFLHTHFVNQEQEGTTV